MKIKEISNAADILALWKLISDNTWTAISQQAEAESRQRAEKAAQAKLKPKVGGKRGGRKSLPPPPHITPPLPPKKPPPPQAKTQVGKQATQQMGGVMNQHLPNSTNPQQPNAQPTQQKAVGMAQQQPNATSPQAAHLQQPHAAQLPLTQQQMRLQRQDVGYLAKNSAVTK